MQCLNCNNDFQSANCKTCKHPVSTKESEVNEWEENEWEEDASYYMETCDGCSLEINDCECDNLFI